MAFTLNLRQVGDYFLLGWNEVPGKPKSGWTPVLGELVRRETAADNEFDVCADTENPQGIVISTNGTNAVGIALFVDGTTIILPTDTAVALNDKITASAGGLKQVGTANFNRTQVKAAVGGVGTVIDLAPFGVSGTGTESTATIAFEGVKP